MAQTDNGRSPFQKRWLVVTAIAVLALIFLIPFFRDGGARVDTNIEVETQTAVTGDIRETTSGTGRIVGLEHWDVTAPYDGAITQWAVEDGASVKAGDLLAVYDTEKLEDTIEKTLSRIEALDEEIRLAGEQNEFTLTAPEAGLVKEVNLQRGDDIGEQVLVRISADGQCVVTITCEDEANAPAKGDKVRISSENLRTEGEVVQWDEDEATILFPDSGEWIMGSDAEVSDLQGHVLGTGKVEIANPLELSSERSGIAVQVLCQAGDFVEQGDALLRGVDVTQEDTCEQLAQERKEAVVQLLALRSFLEKPEIRSEHEGLVSEQAVLPGDTLESGQTLCRIVSQNQYLLSLTIPSHNADRVRAGQKVEFRFDNDTLCTGEVVSEVAQSDLSAVTCPVSARLEDDCGHQVGDEALAEVVLAERKGVVLVPAQGLTVAEDGTEMVNVAYGDGLTHSKTVLTGLHNGSMVEILQGVSEGEEIVISSRIVETTFYSLFNHEWVVNQKEGPMEDGLLTEKQEQTAETESAEMEQGG